MTEELSPFLKDLYIKMGAVIVQFCKDIGTPLEDFLKQHPDQIEHVELYKKSLNETPQS